MEVAVFWHFHDNEYNNFMNPLMSSVSSDPTRDRHNHINLLKTSVWWCTGSETETQFNNLQWESDATRSFLQILINLSPHSFAACLLPKIIVQFPQQLPSKSKIMTHLLFHFLFEYSWQSKVSLKVNKTQPLDVFPRWSGYQGGP